MSVKRKGSLKNAGARLENGVRRGLIQAGMLVAQRAQGKAARDTGRLKRSITHGRPYQTGAGRFAIDVGTNVEYARIQEEGGKIEMPVIYPKTKQALAFDWPNAPANLKPSKSGKFVFAYVGPFEVTIKAHPYLRPALNESKREIRLLILKSVIGALKKR